jgi:hypothetical protein
VLAYISWHRPARDVEEGPYEQALVGFHRSLAHRPPSGFRGSAAFRAAELPWLGPGFAGQGCAGHGPSAGYEDWYLIDGWSAVGVLEEAAVARGHVSRHDALAALAGATSGAIYRLSEGHSRLGEARLAVWVARAPGHAPLTIGDLLGDGMDRQAAGLWRRCLGLGPAGEYCLLAAEAPAGVAATRLPAGWRATTGEREVLWSS